jgi:hypothetical protein
VPSFFTLAEVISLLAKFRDFVGQPDIGLKYNLCMLYANGEQLTGLTPAQNSECREFVCGLKDPNLYFEVRYLHRGVAWCFFLSSETAIPTARPSETNGYRPQQLRCRFEWSFVFLFGFSANLGTNQSNVSSSRSFCHWTQPRNWSPSVLSFEIEPIYDFSIKAGPAR